MKRLLKLLFFLITIGGYAQEKWAVELRPTLHFATREVLDQSLRIGNGIELTGVLSLGKRTEIYGGLLWNRFDTDEDFQDEDIEFIQKGVLVGTLVNFKVFEKQKHLFYARAGLTVMDVKTSSMNIENSIETAVAVGTHIGLGIKIVSLGTWQVLPEIRYGNSSHRYRENGMDRFLSFGNVSITAALRKSF